MPVKDNTMEMIPEMYEYSTCMEYYDKNFPNELSIS
jgi:hypothetical protein